ncbi:MAG TPA: flagellar hook capping FlgD N-terminal domain-containing protein [Acidimicrobiales bacterium]|nr:flagellar hook capping FlgD N-terminal domain-containing protein [Acidimicrobiales bacterium]
MISDITSAAASAATDTNSAQGNTFNGLDKNAFLQLLVAQLRYQNPLAPQDGQAYLQQAAQFATVEKLGNIEQSQNEAVVYQQLVLANTFVGHNVTGLDKADPSSTVSGKVDAVLYDGTKPDLVIGGKEVPVDTVQGVTL